MNHQKLIKKSTLLRKKVTSIFSSPVYSTKNEKKIIRFIEINGTGSFYRSGNA